MRAIDGLGGRFPVSPEDSEPVRWSKFGRELLYGSPQGLFAVSFTPGAKPGIGPPVRLFGLEGELGAAVDLTSAPDGSRFAVLIRKPRPPLTEIRLITNWTETLKK